MAEGSDDVTARNNVRRNMAYAAMLLCIVITMCETACLFNDAMAGRNEKVWPALSILFAALMGYLGVYVQAGSRENRDIIAQSKT